MNLDNVKVGEPAKWKLELDADVFTYKIILLSV
jgi:hypothetical protein